MLCCYDTTGLAISPRHEMGGVGVWGVWGFGVGQGVGVWGCGAWGTGKERHECPHEVCRHVRSVTMADVLRDIRHIRYAMPRPPPSPPVGVRRRQAMVECCRGRWAAGFARKSAVSKESRHERCDIPIDMISRRLLY